MIEMSQLGSAFLDSVVAADGGFVWWYADLLDEAGNGLVVIWSLGLPFLPNTRLGGAATQRPSISFAYYPRGLPGFYLLQEHPHHTVGTYSPEGSTSIGASRFEVTTEGMTTRVNIELDEPLPNTSERLVASIQLSGHSPTLVDPSEGAFHLWTPRLLHAEARADFTVGTRHETLSGVGYFDGNASLLPLHDQGIESWRWARFTLGKRAFVVYDVGGTQPDARVLEADGEGALRALRAKPRFGDHQRGLYGITSPRRIELDLEQERLICVASRQVDEGPFYQRFVLDVRSEPIEVASSVTARLAGNPGHSSSARGGGFYEVVVPDRIDRPWQRPFIRMRTHRIGGENSALLPFFTGWEDRRVSRVLADFAARLERRVRRRRPAGPGP